jgi:hypothetical protein
LEAEPYKAMFVKLGNALMGREQWDKALECFAKLQESEAVSLAHLSRKEHITYTERLTMRL